MNPTLDGLATISQRNMAMLRALTAPPEPARRTPHRVVHRHGKAQLRYFAPENPSRAPIFISMPLINTWTIWDLLPERSVVGALVKAGAPVYLLDWGRPGPEDAENPLSTYVEDILGRAIDAARRHAGGLERIHCVGYCVGGTFLALHLGGRPEVVEKLALVCTPIDFHASGRLAKWASPENFPIEHLRGNYPADMMKQSFAWLRPMGQTRKWFSLWEKADKAGFAELWGAMEAWNDDAVDFPGQAYKDYVRTCYFENRTLQLLSAGKAPALAIAADGDHIVPAPAAFALERAWGGPVTCRSLAGGHVGISVSPALPRTLLDFFA